MRKRRLASIKIDILGSDPSRLHRSSSAEEFSGVNARGLIARECRRGLRGMRDNKKRAATCQSAAEPVDGGCGISGANTDFNQEEQVRSDGEGWWRLARASSPRKPRPRVRGGAVSHDPTKMRFARAHTHVIAIRIAAPWRRYIGQLYTDRRARCRRHASTVMVQIRWTYLNIEPT